MPIPSRWVDSLLSHVDGAALRLALVVAAAADDCGGAVSATVAELATRAGVCERHARRALRDLRAGGFLLVSGDAGGVLSYVPSYLSAAASEGVPVASSPVPPASAVLAAPAASPAAMRGSLVRASGGSAPFQNTPKRSDNIEKVQCSAAAAPATSGKMYTGALTPALHVPPGSACPPRLSVSPRTIPPSPSFSPSPGPPPPLTPPSPLQASKQNACLPADFSIGANGKRPAAGVCGQIAPLAGPDAASVAARTTGIFDAFGEIPPADDPLVRRLCDVGTLTVPFRWRSVGTEIGAAELIAKYGRDCVAAALACVLEKKRIEGKRDGTKYRPSPGYLLAALRGDWAGWNLPAAVESRTSAARKSAEAADRRAAAARVLADAAAAARSAESAEESARAAVVEWVNGVSADVVREVVAGVLASVSGLVRSSVVTAARKADADESGQARAAAVHRLIVEQVAAAAAARVGRRVEPVGV